MVCTGVWETCVIGEMARFTAAMVDAGRPMDGGRAGKLVVSTNLHAGGSSEGEYDQTCTNSAYPIPKLLNSSNDRLKLRSNPGVKCNDGQVASFSVCIVGMAGSGHKFSALGAQTVFCENS